VQDRYKLSVPNVIFSDLRLPTVPQNHVDLGLVRPGLRPGRELFHFHSKAVGTDIMSRSLAGYPL
ncbi:MAG: hypothetical protein ACRD2O_07065, partial [Terriglobia bacterium]